MKNYTKKITITKPKLVIEYDKYAQSPREDTNLGYFITVDSKIQSPDKNEQLEKVVKETGEYVGSQEEHIKAIKKDIEQLNEQVIAIYPITKYEHSGVSYSLGTQHGFDNSNNGFYIITNKTQEEIDVPTKDFEKIIKSELETYNQYINGEIFRFTLYDDKGEEEDTCSGFYDLEAIQQNLPSEWKDEDMEEYFNN